jgi:hypothetical protein
MVGNLHRIRHTNRSILSCISRQIPYNIYGAQQDNSSIRIASRSSGNDIGPESWYAVAGGEAGYIEADPTNADITYGGE